MTPLNTLVKGFRASLTLDQIDFSRVGGGMDTSLRGAGMGHVALANNRWITYEALYITQPWVRAAVDVLKDGIGRLPLHVYVDGGTPGERQRQRDGYLAELIDSPGDGRTPTFLKASIVGNLAVHGNAILVKHRPGPGMPPDELVPSNFGFWYVQPGTTRPVDWYVFTAWNGVRIPFLPEEVMHFHSWGPGHGIVASSKMEALRTTLLNEDAAQRTIIAAFENGMRPIGAYSIDTVFKDPVAAERMRAQLDAVYGGVDNAFKVMLLEGGAKWQAMSQSFIDSEMTKLRMLNREEVSAVMHVPQPIMGILDHATFSNISEQHLMLYMDTYHPYTTLIEETVDVQLIEPEPTMAGQYVEFNYKEVMRGNPETELKMLALAVGGPFMTPNEARATQNLPALDGGDELLPPRNQSIPADTPANAPAAAGV